MKYTLILLLLSTQTIQAKEYTAYTGNFGSYSKCSDSKNPGLFPAVLQTVLKELDHTFKCVLKPWKRAQSKVIISNDEKFIFPLTRTTSRESNYKWISKIVTDKKVFFASKKLDIIPTKNISKFLKLRIGVIQGSPYEKQLTSLKFPKIDSAKNAELNAKKLIKGRIDLWYVPFNTGMQTFKKLSIDSGKYYVFHTVGEANIYLGASKSTPDSLIKKVQSKVELMRKDGRLDDLYYKYDIVSEQKK